MSFFKKLFGSHKESEQKPQEVLPPDTHILWDDDFAMVEFVPRENIDFIVSETERINSFGKQNKNEFGFIDITPIGKKQVGLFEKSIDFKSFIATIEKSGIKRIQHFSHQTEPLLKGENCPIGYGTKNYSIMCVEKEGLLLDLWLSQFPRTLEEKKQLTNTLIAIGLVHDFYVVNWYNSTYCDLTDQISIEDFMVEYGHMLE